MRLFVRCLLWILIAALPLQGGAAAFMSPGAERVQVASAMHEMHDMDVATDGNHAQMAQEHCHESSPEKSSLSHTKCSHCASCCVGAAAPPVSSADLASVPFSTVASSAVEPAMTAYFPATLERPPRHLP